MLEITTASNGVHPAEDEREIRLRKELKEKGKALEEKQKLLRVKEIEYRRLVVAKDRAVNEVIVPSIRERLFYEYLLYQLCTLFYLRQITFLFMKSHSIQSC